MLKIVRRPRSVLNVLERAGDHKMTEQQTLRDKPVNEDKDAFDSAVDSKHHTVHQICFLIYSAVNNKWLLKLQL